MENLAKIITFLFVLATSSYAFGQPSESMDKDSAQKAQSLLEEQNQFKNSVGTTAGIYKQGRIYWSGAAGFANKEKKLPAKSDMIHRIASISKPMTAVAILQLVEKKKLELDVPIQKYLPDYPKKAKGDFTIRQLLNHTSGIPHYQSKKDLKFNGTFENLTDALDLFKNRALAFEPGTDYMYSTYGYTVLGAIIEQVTGLSYNDYMTKAVWGPAGMTRTSVEFPGVNPSGTSALYKQDKKGRLVSDKWGPLTYKYPGGGIRSTSEDLLRFAGALMEGKLLSEASMQMMMEAPSIEKQGAPYGLGWFLAEDEKYGRVIRHGGAQAGTSTFLSIYWDANIAVTAISNTADQHGWVGHVTNTLGRIAMNEEIPEDELLFKPYPLSEKELKSYKKKFRFENGKKARFRPKNGRLQVNIKGNPTFYVYPEGPDLFRLPWTPIQFRFERNTLGEIEKAYLIQSGQEILMQ